MPPFPAEKPKVGPLTKLSAPRLSLLLPLPGRTGVRQRLTKVLARLRISRVQARPQGLRLHFGSVTATRRTADRACEASDRREAAVAAARTLLSCEERRTAIAVDVAVANVALAARALLGNRVKVDFGRKGHATLGRQDSSLFYER